jgi:hypothetical protein
MKGKAMLKKTFFAFSFVLLISSLSTAQVPQLINYQGMLSDASGTASSGSYSIEFKIYDSATSGSVLWAETQTVTVVEGLFDVLLGSATPIPYSVFDGSNKYLSLKIGGDSEMTPRKRLVSVGYSLRAYNADKVGGKDASAFVQNVDGVPPNNSGNVDLVAGDNVIITPDTTNNKITISATPGGGGNNWSLFGNSGTTSGTNFLGTTDNQPLEFRVNNSRALRLEIPDPLNPGLKNIICGSNANYVSPGVYGATISGGGAISIAESNRVTDYFGTVSGGINNQAGDGDNVFYNAYGSTVGGGVGNMATGSYSTVGGGWNNESSGIFTTVSGGISNIARGLHATVPGGAWNDATGDYSLAAGKGAKANHKGTFVWSDTTVGNFLSTEPNQFLIRATGGVGIGLNNPNEMFSVAGKIESTMGGFKFPDGSLQTTAATGGQTDNLGNHTMTQNIISNGYFISGDRQDAGLRVNSDGGVFIGSDIGPVEDKRDLFVDGSITTNMSIKAYGYKSKNGVEAMGNECGVTAAGGYYGILGNSGGSGVYGLGVGDDNSIGVYGKSHGKCAGKFESDYESDDTHVLHAEFTGENNNAIAVYGKSAPQDLKGFGGYFEGGHRGVMGIVNTTGSGAFGMSYTGVYGKVDAAAGTVEGVAGFASNGSTNKGLYGSASNGTTSYGVQGFANGASSNNYGVYGNATGGNGTNYGVYGSAWSAGNYWAGWFEGSVNVTHTLTKGAGAFKIDHPLDPENKYLSHSFVESPDMMNVYNGNVNLDGNGEATIELPDWFEALNKDFRYQLTCIGGFAQVYIAEEIGNNQFKIAGGKPGLKISWQVTGIRKDAFANAHRIPVEEGKKGEKRGRYLHAKELGFSEELEIGYEERKAMEQENNRLMEK